MSSLPRRPVTPIDGIKQNLLGLAPWQWGRGSCYTLGLRCANRATAPPGHKPTEGSWVPHPWQCHVLARSSRHRGTILLTADGGAKESEDLIKMGATQFAAKQKGGKG